MTTQHQISQPLSKYINRIYYTLNEQPFKMQKVFPTPFVNLTFNLGGPIKFIESGDFKQSKLYKYTMLTGIQQEYLLFENPEVTETITVEFKPFGLNQFVSIPLTKVTNKVTDINRIIPESKILPEELKSLDVESKLKRVEEFLLKNFKNQQGEYFVANKIIEELEKNPDLKLESLTKSLSISKENLNQLFKKLTGTVVPNLALIYKFEKVTKAIRNDKDVNWIELINLDNDYEVNLFSKKFEQFAGVTVDEYINTVHSLKQDPTEFIKSKRR